MAVAGVNQEQIIGSLIPDVYIKTITLETTGTPIRETNPHIEHSRESAKFKKSPTDNFLIANLDLLLKEKLDGGMIDTWFSNQDFQKYLRFMVIQSTDSLVTKMLSSSNNAIQMANMKNSAVDTVVFIAELMGELKNLPEFSSIGGKAPIYSERDTPELLKLILDNTEVKYVSVKEHLLNNKTLLNQQHSTTNSRGDQVFDITFRLKFEIPTKTPQHLSYFAVSSLDIDQLIDDFNLDMTDMHLFELMNGKVAADTVISAGNLVSKAFVFKDTDGRIWSGPVHQAGSGWLTGTVDSEIKTALTKHEVENNKIQDFRNFDELEKLQLDFSVVQNKLFNFKLPFKRLTNDNMDIPRIENYFSDAALSRDSAGACRFAFAMDYGKLIQDHTQYGALYNKSNRDELLENVKIRHFRIKRRRMKREYITLNSLGSPTPLRDVFDQDEVEEVISITGESKPGTMQMFKGPKGSVRELEIELGVELDGVRHFMGVDRTMPRVTDGYYQYGIEIEVEDYSNRFILRKLRDLSGAKYWLDYYYNTATLPNHFDPVSNRFTQEFIEKMYSTYGWASGQKPLIASPWIKPLITYLSILSFFRKMPINLKLASAMWKYLDPKSGNPRGIAMVQKLVENLLQRLASAVGTNLESHRSRGVRADSDGNFVRPASIVKPGRPQLKTFKVEYYFPHIFDSNIPKGLGYDFLSHGSLEKESNDDGLRVITSAEYERRTELETLKYFTSATADVNMSVGSETYTQNDSLDNTRLSFLTPSNVSLGREGNISLLANPFDAQTSLKIQTKVANMNLTRKSPFTPSLPPLEKNPQTPVRLGAETIKTKNELTSIMSNFGCTLVTPISSPFHNMAQLVQMDYDPYTEVADILGEEWMSIDSVPPNESDEAHADEHETSKNPIPIFASLAFPVFMNGAGMSGIFSNFNLGSPMAGRENKKKSEAHFNMDFYDLTNLNGAIGSLRPSALALPSSSPMTTIGAPVRATTVASPKRAAVLADLPNQIKSLFLAGDTSAKVRHKWVGAKASLLQLPAGKAAFILNYKNLRKTEVMIGYQLDDRGFPFLNQPIWVRLTPKTMALTESKNLLCRTVKYENKAFGVVEATGMRLPTYNKYFIISRPTTKQTIGLLRRGRTLYRDKLSRRINKILRQHRFLSGEYLSTAVVNSKRTVPSPVTRRRVTKKLDLSEKVKPSTKVI